MTGPPSWSPTIIRAAAWHSWRRPSTGAHRRPRSLTAPDPSELRRCLAALADDGVECLAMEASSHGLDQYRLDGVRVTAAAFTNLTRDHLDYHGGMAAYGQAQLR